MKKILKMISNNAGLKILAFIFAVGLWLYVLNVEDPEITRSFSVQVSFEDTDTLTDVDKDFEVLNDTDTVRVTVSAQRSIIEELSSSDFNAVCYLSDLSGSQLDGEQELEVYISLNRYSSKVSIVSDTRYTTISIEDELSKTIEVTAETSGSPASGYAVGDVNVLPGTVTISGVTSLIEDVETAQVVVDVSGMEEDLTQTAQVLFFNADGMLVDTSDMTLTAEEVTVYVDCDVVKTLTLVFDESGTPASGYRVTDISGSVTEIQVQGEADAVDGLEYLRISGSALDVTDAKEDVTVTVNPADYLTYGVSIYGDEVTVEITITIVKYESVTLKVPSENIVYENLENGYTVSAEAEYVYVTVSCPESMSDTISADSVTLTADLSGLTEGTYYISLAAEIPDEVILSSSPSVTIVIEEEE